MLNPCEGVEVHTYVATLSSLSLPRVSYSEEEPFYSRSPIHLKLEALDAVRLLQPSAHSYIAVLWTCQSSKVESAASFLMVTRLATGSVVGIVPVKMGPKTSEFWGEDYEAGLNVQAAINFLRRECCSNNFDLEQIQSEVAANAAL